LLLENSLRRALERNELLLLYQPQMDSLTGQIVGMEALIRWQHPELGMIPPAKFIPIAEDSGLIVPIGEWVIQEACRQNKSWQGAGLPCVPVAVNLSAIQFRQSNFSAVIERALHTSGLDPRYLELEVTESAFVEDVDRALATMQALKTMGLSLAIDDFGTGYSSLAYLRRFPIDKLKVDRSFVRDIVTDPGDASLCSAIISLAEILGLDVVAEGVETDAQLAFLQQHGCAVMQGFYFSRPVAAEDVDALLRDNADSISPESGAFSAR
jgi:EAL domain-containing protein (putative c-di-GMP-specific phosphodiesterase class I)